MQRGKVCFILIDGLGDVSNKDIAGLKTPLQAGKTPNLDTLARLGVCGLMDPVEPGFACGSDTAHLSILGYDPRVHYHGRGSFESMGAGLPMDEGDIAFKCNFATIDSQSRIVTSRRADRNFEREGPILSEYLNDRAVPGFPSHRVNVKYATEHRCGVRISGPDLCDSITGTDPLKDGRLLLAAMPTEDAEAARTTAAVTNAVSDLFERLLTQHPINGERERQGKPPANCVLLRGCGIRIKVPTFESLHGLKAFMIAPTAIIKGLGMTLGLDIVDAGPRATGDCHTDVEAKADAFIRTVTAPHSQYRFGFLHIKAIDDAGHDRRLDIKLDFLARIDAIVGRLCLTLAPLGFSIVVTGDHTTPIAYGDHSTEPVPFVFCPMALFCSDGKGSGANIAPAFAQAAKHNKAMGFNEIDCRAGALGRFPGSETMRIINTFIS